MRSRTSRARRDPLARGDLAVSGGDLQALGAAGARIGEVLGLLLDRVLDDPSLNTRDALLALGPGARCESRSVFALAAALGNVVRRARRGAR